MTRVGTLAERIATAYSGLSPQEQRAADFMREHLADLAVYNATEVAGLSGVSKATISRLYRRLGFGGADDLRDHLRSLRSAGVPVAGDTPATFADHLEQEFVNLRATMAGLDVGPAATLIANARRVLVIGFRNSYPMALHLRQQLAQVRGAVELAPLPGQSLGEELASLSAEDIVILVGFRRRPESFARVVATVEASGTHSVLLTDASGRRYAGHVSTTIECSVDSVSAFDSYAAAASVVSLLASAVLDRRPRDGRERIARIGAAYDSLEELESL